MDLSHCLDIFEFDFCIQILSSNGKFKFNTYVPPTGKKLKIEVTEG